MVISPFLLVCAAVAATPSRARPADTLASLTLGEPFLATGFVCEADGCVKPMSLAGIGGSVTVVPCNGRVQTVAWVSDDAPTSDTLVAWGHALAGPLLSAGWTSTPRDATVSYSPLLGDVTSKVIDLVSPDGRLRQLTILRAGESMNVAMAATHTTPCTEGLGL